MLDRQGIPHNTSAADIELTQAALKACGYRTKLRERCGTQWVEAVKGLDVRYAHWHPLTNITQAMQLLVDAPGFLFLEVSQGATKVENEDGKFLATVGGLRTAQDLINAQCRAIVTAIAGLQV